MSYECIFTNGDIYFCNCGCGSTTLDPCASCGLAAWAIAVICVVSFFVVLISLICICRRRRLRRKMLTMNMTQPMTQPINGSKELPQVSVR